MQQLASKEVVSKIKSGSSNSPIGKVKSLMHVQPLISTIMIIARRAVNASVSSLLLSEEGGKKLIFIFADGPLGQIIRRLKISKNSGIAGWVARNGEPLIVNDVSESKYFNMFTEEITGLSTKSLICAPLGTGQKVIGAVEVINKLGTDFSEQDLQTLTLISASIT